jgi:hypothetical protein
MSVKQLLQQENSKSYLFRKCVIVALDTQREIRTSKNFIYGLSSPTVFFHIIS